MNEEDKDKQNEAAIAALRLLAKMATELFKSFRKEGLSIKESAALTIAILGSQMEAASEAASEASPPNPLTGLEGLDFED